MIGRVTCHLPEESIEVGRMFETQATLKLP